MNCGNRCRLFAQKKTPGAKRPCEHSSSATRATTGLGHMTLVISEKKFPPMCCGPKRVIPKLYRTCGLTALRDLTKASQDTPQSLDIAIRVGAPTSAMLLWALSIIGRLSAPISRCVLRASVGAIDL